MFVDLSCRPLALIFESSALVSSFLRVSCVTDVIDVSPVVLVGTTFMWAEIHRGTRRQARSLQKGL